VRTDAASKSMDLEWIPVRQTAGKKLDAIPLNDLADGLIEPSVRARTSILEALDAVPVAHADQVSRRPRASFEAITRYVGARRELASALQSDDDTLSNAAFGRAVELADQAIKDSPNFLDAYLLKASCQEQLDDEEAIKQTLKNAWQRKDPPEHDLLTLLELEGDHSRFVDGDLDGAYDSCEAILKIDPTNLTGLWTMISILLAADPTTVPDPVEASKYAATLVACHPQSAVARAILSVNEK
jgi:tetratricopeptide (TPR) repeat protein